MQITPLKMPAGYPTPRGETHWQTALVIHSERVISFLAAQV